jgi:hypothetical protein
MEQTIINMINEAERNENYSLIGYVKDLISKFATTINCPSNWRNIGSTLAETYDTESWTYEQLELWNHED